MGEVEEISCCFLTPFPKTLPKAHGPFPNKCLRDSHCRVKPSRHCPDFSLSLPWPPPNPPSATGRGQPGLKLREGGLELKDTQRHSGPQLRSSSFPPTGNPYLASPGSSRGQS